MVAGLAVALLACDTTLAPVPPEGPDADVAPLPAGFQRGMNLQPIGDYGGLLDDDEVEPALDALVRLGVTHVAVIPSFFQHRLGDVEMYWRPSRVEVDAQTRRVVSTAHALGLEVLLKPHLWLEDRSDGAWRGEIDPAPADWPAWAAGYRGIVLDYARLAAELEVAGLSIGSELTRLAVGRPDFWRALVRDVRAEYGGSVTYAANWDAEFEAISWWDALDHIGVDAFWPLVDTPDEALEATACRRRLGAALARMQRVAASADRPLLLTEIGYKSATGAAYRPWEWHDRQGSDPALQAQLYRCIRDVFGPADRVAGIYLWIWYTDPRWGGPANSDFTPRGKAAEGVLAGWFRAR